MSRSGQISLRVFVEGPLDRPDVRALIDAVLAENGCYEVRKNSKHASLLLLSLHVDLGLDKIKSITRMVAGPHVQWEFGNVHDENGKYMNWWRTDSELS